MKGTHLLLRPSDHHLRNERIARTTASARLDDVQVPWRGEGYPIVWESGTLGNYTMNKDCHITYEVGLGQRERRHIAAGSSVLNATCVKGRLCCLLLHRVWRVVWCGGGVQSAAGNLYSSFYYNSSLFGLNETDTYVVGARARIRERGKSSGDGERQPLQTATTGL